MRPYNRLSSELAYSGLDRHSFGMTKITPVTTPPDKGPWAWDRTGGPQDFETPAVRTRVEPGELRRCYHKGYAHKVREWVRALPPGSEFRTRDSMAGIGRKTDDSGSIVSGAFRGLLAEDTVEKISVGKWRRL